MGLKMPFEGCLVST